MQTDPECLACFMQQALATARLSSGDLSVQRQVLDEVGQVVSRLDMSLSPPENAMQVYGLIAEITGEDDPFAEAKVKSTELALALRDEVQRRIGSAANPLYEAIRYAIASNIIDYGAQHEFDALESMLQCLEQKFTVDDFVHFEREIAEYTRPNILYLADNCGEIVFDGLLIEQLINLGCSVTMVVREDVILNDVTLNEVANSQINGLCPVMTSGTACPGTPLHVCSNEIQKAFGRSDFVISKGQGNFETLSESGAPIYFLLTVKCKVVGRHIAEMKGVSPERLKGRGEMILMRKETEVC